MFAIRPALFQRQEVVKLVCTNFRTSMVRSCGDPIFRVNTINNYQKNEANLAGTKSSGSFFMVRQR